MHQACDGKVIGVAVFLQPGSANVAIRQLWQGMPNTPGKAQEVVGVEMNPAGLLPPTRFINRYVLFIVSAGVGQIQER
jgi:carbonic anhydrase